MPPNQARRKHDLIIRSGLLHFSNGHLKRLMRVAYQPFLVQTTLEESNLRASKSFDFLNVVFVSCFDRSEVKTFHLLTHQNRFNRSNCKNNNY